MQDLKKFMPSILDNILFVLGLLFVFISIVSLAEIIFSNFYITTITFLLSYYFVFIKLQTKLIDDYWDNIKL